MTMFTFTPITLVWFVVGLGICSAKNPLGDARVTNQDVLALHVGKTMHNDEHVTFDQGQHCQDIWINESRIAIGEICMHLESNSSLSVLVVSYKCHQGWMLDKSYLWVGSNLADMPRQQGVHGTQPALSQFPYVHQNKKGQCLHEEQIALTLGEIQQPIGSGGNTLTQQIAVAAYPVTQPASTQTQPGSKESQHSHLGVLVNTQNDVADDNKVTMRKGQSWMEFTLKVDMHPSQGVPTVTNLQQHSRQLYMFSPREPNANCFSTPTTLSAEREQQVSELFTESFLFQFHVASILSTNVIYDENLLDQISYYQTIYERFNAYDDGWDDAALVAKVNNVCYGVFRGTVRENPADHLQNYLIGFRKVPETTCYVRTGYYEAYFTNYQTQFEQDLQDCVQSCTDAECELILTGASQGGACAVVAAMYHYERYDPLVFTFGAPRVFLPTSPFDDNMACTNVDKDKQYHFILADSYLKAYDPVPSYFAYWTKNVGREILYDGEGQFNDQGIPEAYLSRRDPGNQDVHSKDNYYHRSISAYENACLPIPMRGWLDGHWCSDDVTCQETSYCGEDGYCTQRLDLGNPCSQNSQCLSNACSSELGVCTQEEEDDDDILALDGESCWRNNDCLSGRCEGYFGLSRCQEPLESGQPCNEHADCLSGHCAGFFLGECL